MSSNEVPSKKNKNIIWRREDVLLIFGVLAVLPLMYLQSQHLAERKHLQFFPISWLTFAGLLYRRLSFTLVGSVWRFRLGSTAMLFALSLAAFAMIRFSPWLAHLSTLTLVIGWLLVRAGENLWTEIVSWISVLAITLPLPNNLDSLLIQRLQHVSTNSASSLLDLLSVPHVARGNILEIRIGELFVDEACSGIDSLYSLAAIAIILVVWNRSSFFIGLATLAMVPLWAWLGNLIRIFLIAFLLDRHAIDLSSGWPHTALGLCVFSLSALSLFFMHEIARRLLTPFPVETVTTNSFHRWFNRAVSWPAASPTARKARSSKESTKAAQEGVALREGKIPLALLAIACLVCVLVGAGSFLPLYGVGPWDNSKYALPSWTTQQVSTVFKEGDLPAQLNGLTRRSFSVIHRDTGSIYGEHSATWIYQDSSGQEVQLSFDFPFPGFHGLEACYTAAGQEVVGAVDESSKQTVGGINVTCYRCFLRDNISQTSVLLYTNIDSNGADVPKPLPSLLGTAWERPPIAYQSQLFLSQCGELSDARLAEFEQVLLLTNDILAQKLNSLLAIRDSAPRG